jgi:hypothetical protein
MRNGQDRGDFRRHEQRRPYSDERRDRKAGVPWWVWLLGGLLLIGLLWLMFSGLNDSDVATDGSNTGTSTGTGAGTGAGATGSGTITAGSTDLLPLSSQDGGALQQYEGQNVEGNSVAVESVVSDEGLWVGESQEERMFVFLDLPGESGPDVDAGDMVSFSGTVEAVPQGFEDRFGGIEAEEGADQLSFQGSYIEVTSLNQEN